MYSVENHVGRLIESRLGTPLAIEEVERCITRIRTLVTTIPHRIVFCVDLTRVEVLAPDVSERFLAMMRADNPQVERTGYLVRPANAIVALQIERMIRDAHHPARKSFRAAPELAAWLEPVLSPAEQRQLRAFLASIAA